jgi:hypothetical protein
VIGMKNKKIEKKPLKSKVRDLKYMKQVSIGGTWKPAKKWKKVL